MTFTKKELAIIHDNLFHHLAILSETTNSSRKKKETKEIKSILSKIAIHRGVFEPVWDRKNNRWVFKLKRRKLLRCLAGSQELRIN